MGALTKVKGFGSLFWKRWKGASSTIVFYLIQFLLVLWLFGADYAMVVSGSTTLFQIRRREPNRLEDYLSMVLMSLVLCLLVHLAYPWLPGLPGVFLFSLVMISLMYCCTPGTWVQPIFSISFALTMATLTIQTYEAIWLRLFYLAIAVALVLVVNTYLLPSRKEPQFRRNLQELYRLQAQYWAVIRRSLSKPVDPGLFGELLAQFHMVYHEAAQFAAQLPEDQLEYHHRRLVILWNMFSELEQTESLIQIGAVTPEEGTALEGVSAALEKRVCPLTSMADVDLNKLPKGELYYVIHRYLENAGQLVQA